MNNDEYLFVGHAKTETFLKDFNRLREAIRQHDSFKTEEAWDKCERWISCIRPSNYRGNYE